MNFLPNAQDQNSKRALKSATYKTIARFLSTVEAPKTKAKVKFLIILCKKTKWFLTKLQSERPQIHELYIDSGSMFLDIARLVIKPEALTGNIQDYSKIDLEENLLHSTHCGFLAQLDPEMKDLDSDTRKKLRREMRAAVLAMLEYLQSHLPLDDELLMFMGFLNPDKRNTDDNAQAGKWVASKLKRFTELELDRIFEQLSFYVSLPGEAVPKFEGEKRDRLDSWWAEVTSIIRMKTGEEPVELNKLVQLCLTISHGQGMVESGFASTKWFVTNRNSLGDTSVKALKMVQKVCKRFGGAENVPITTQLLNSAKSAVRNQRQEEARESERKERDEKDAAVERVAIQKRRAEEESHKCWDDKKKLLEEKINGIKGFISTQNRNLSSALEKGLMLTDPSSIKMNMYTVQFCQKNVLKQSEEMDKLNEELKHHIGKKPKRF